MRRKISERELKFISWLSKRDNVKKSAKKYASAINTVGNDLNKYLGKVVDIYLLNESKEVEYIYQEYINVNELNSKNIRGKSMYTQALNWYRLYLEEDYRATESSTKEGQKHLISYEKRHRECYNIVEGKRQWKRNSDIKNKVIETSNFKCEVNNDHCNFISNNTGENYVEGHHIIPMKFQDEFEWSLDVEANIISICVVCHKILHHGIMEDKLLILNKIYKLRKIPLELSGLYITIEELINLYENT